ncbi:GerMN domain-containing protein [Shimazuella sp. AN120528]|uniref:GerMN domain-containing protein n=1 Tax=Shimazuella soli TaxID=1892854 RepID=UPI001F0EB959|nr:GerMN domain-containing protein [Shimazuella soli]MCH5584631.1 GerMN domain-containing protein [Shimazuella soli]
MRNKAKAMVCMLLFPVALTGCFFDPNVKASKPIDPPQSEAQVVHAKAEPKKETQGHLTELYTLNQDGYVMPYSVKLSGKSLAKRSLESLIEGSQTATLLPKGTKSVLPKGTRVLSVKIKKGVATANFSKEFKNYKQEDETKILNAITWTLTGFSNIKSVNLQIEGKKLALMPKGKTVAQGLTRADGINVEVANGVDISASMPVTLYFLSQSDDDSISYVPVTRLVNRSSNIGETVVKELVKGPMENSHLIGPLDTATTIKGVKIEGKQITANFGKDILQYNDQTAASKSALESIVLSLTQNINVSKVKIVVDGKTTIGVINNQGNNVDLPVSRPKQVNPSGL